MKSTIAKYFNYHVYPRFLFRHPSLIRIVHGWNNLVLQRNWLVNKALKPLLAKLPPDAQVLDAGCGDGLHIFSNHRKFPSLWFWGIDKNEGNIAFCRKYTERLTVPFLTKTNRLHFSHQNLEDLSSENAFDLIFCTGTLQYVEDDQQVLNNFAKALKPGGRLVIYVPVNGRIILPPYRFLYSKMEHYETSQGRKRIYSAPEIVQKTTGTGLELVMLRYSYGTLGILSHEIYSLCLLGMGNTGFFGLLFIILLLLLLPILLLLTALDFLMPETTGNGLLLVLVKKQLIFSSP